MLVVVPDTLNNLINSFLVWYHSLGLIFYIKILDLIWSNDQVAVSNPKERRHLREPIGGQCQNSGSPDRRKSGGDGGLILARLNTRLKARLYLVKGSRDISTKVSLPAGFEKLGNLRELNTIDKTTANTKVLDLLSDIDILIAAYSKLKSSPSCLCPAYAGLHKASNESVLSADASGRGKSKGGNMTPGVDSETLDGIDNSWFEKLKKEIRTNSFQFRPARRIEIPKPNGKGTRPLGIASPRDKIVQGAMLLILEAIFEPSFVTHAHGFRPGKGCHTALKEIKGTFSSVNWFIEGDISKCFDTFDHKLLVQLVSKRIMDKGFIDLLHKALKAGYMFQGQYHSPELGTPQGSIVSPILCNILLHGLDEFVLDLQLNFQLLPLTLAFDHPLVSNQSGRDKRAKVGQKQGLLKASKPLWRKLTRAGLIKEVHDRNIGSRLHTDPSYKRLKYVRYADDFLIGIIGSKEDCVKTRDKIHQFLFDELKLNLNLDKTKITHARVDKAHFLGTDISITPLEKRPLRFITRGTSQFRMKANTKPLLQAPIKKLVSKLTEKGFAKHGGTPTRLARMTPFETNQIVKHFWQIWLGLSTYYSFADNYGSLGRIHYILKYSCVLTLASKLKLKTAKRVFAKFGKDILIKDKDDKIIASFPEAPLAKPKTFHITKFTDMNPMARLEKLAKSTFRSKAVLDSTCTAFALLNASSFMQPEGMWNCGKHRNAPRT